MNIGVVVIGRNEGERLGRCLRALKQGTTSIVYVDSGSTDGSLELARSLGAETVTLDMTLPFNAARARNAGYERLVKSLQQPDYIQFIDGDCELLPDWLPDAVRLLTLQKDLAIVAGRLKELHPEASIYNRLGEMEWNIQGAGDVDAVGGIFMIRREAFAAVGGFDASVPAGEEPELCQRLRQQGWRILRVDREMAWHDLAITHFSQWWRRQVRTGYGGLDVATRFGLANFRRNNIRARFWATWPLLAGVIGWIGQILAGPMTGWLAFLMTLAILPAQIGRIALRTWKNGQPLGVALAYGFFTMLSFWPQLLGQWRYFLDWAISRTPRLIEYKTSGIPTEKRQKTCSAATKGQP
jgi:glycosyltransferase involved in cell wall biosynthesis